MKGMFDTASRDTMAGVAASISVSAIHGSGVASANSSVMSAYSCVPSRGTGSSPHPVVPELQTETCSAITAPPDSPGSHGGSCPM